MNKYEIALSRKIKHEGKKITLREYFRALLETLWHEVEQFSGKRPFGNSGWDYDVYAVLLRNGDIPGVLDDDGHIEELDEDKAIDFVCCMIAEVFAPARTKEPDRPAFVRDHEKRISEFEKDLEEYKAAAEADEAEADEAITSMTDGVLQMTARIKSLEAEIERLKVQNTALGAC